MTTSRYVLNNTAWSLQPQTLDILTLNVYTLNPNLGTKLYFAFPWVETVAQKNKKIGGWFIFISWSLHGDDFAINKVVIFEHLKLIGSYLHTTSWRLGFNGRWTGAPSLIKHAAGKGSCRYSTDLTIYGMVCVFKNFTSISHSFENKKYKNLHIFIIIKHFKMLLYLIDCFIDYFQVV